jgi:hypothetical protein
MNQVVEVIDDGSNVSKACEMCDQLVQDPDVAGAVVLLLDHDGNHTIGYSRVCRCSIMNLLGDATITINGKVNRTCESCPTIKPQ